MYKIEYGLKLASFTVRNKDHHQKARQSTVFYCRIFMSYENGSRSFINHYETQFTEKVDSEQKADRNDSSVGQPPCEHASGVFPLLRLLQD